MEAPPTAIFIEPSTGFMCESGCKQYILIDSVWNQYNYYVNKQTYQRVSELRWDLREIADWGHMLPGEPPEMRTYKVSSDENIADGDTDINEEKHLDAICSWVNRLHIGYADYEHRFPKSEKKVQYYGAIHERFSPYSQRDGKVMQLTLFNDKMCTDPKVRYEYYKNRFDLMEQLVYTYENDHYEEHFAKGRTDSLKCKLSFRSNNHFNIINIINNQFKIHCFTFSIIAIEYFSDSSLPRKLKFISSSRLDTLETIDLTPGLIILNYTGQGDRCCYREYLYKPNGVVLKVSNVRQTKFCLPLPLPFQKVVEKFHRAEKDDIVANDIASRTFLFQQNKIIIKFHYTFGALTATTVEFTKPPKPDYGTELVYDEKLTKIYRV